MPCKPGTGIEEQTFSATANVVVKAFCVVLEQRLRKRERALSFQVLLVGMMWREGKWDCGSKSFGSLSIRRDSRKGT